MSSSQDRNNVNRRTKLWIYGTGIALYLTGMSFIASVSLSPSAMQAWWSKVGFLLVALSIFAIITIPGALLAFRHPWGAAFRSMAERGRFAHPRLQGFAAVWAGLILSGSTGAILFAPDPLSSIADWSHRMLVAGLVAFAPLLALVLFDRRR